MKTSLTDLMRRFICAWRTLVRVYAESQDAQKRLPGFDLLRFLAFILVVVHHVQPGFDKFSTAAFPGLRGCGRLGVSLFIVLSGASLALKSFSGDGVVRFYRKRLAQILPAYWVSYFVTAIILFVFMDRISMRGDVAKILQTLFGMDGFLMTQYKNYYLVGEWFVGFIMIMYIASPLIYKCILCRPLTTLFVCLMISAASFRCSPWLSSFLPVWNKAAHFNVTSRVFEFAFGMYFCIRLRRNLSLHCATAALGAIYLLVMAWVLHKPFLEISIYGICAQVSMFAIISLPLGFLPERENRWNGIVRWLATSSFLAFLYHHRIIYVLEARLPVGNDTSRFVYFCLTTIFLSYTLAYLTAPLVGTVKELVFGCRRHLATPGANKLAGEADVTAN